METTKLIPLDSPKVGDLVFSIISGNGVINKIVDKNKTNYPIIVNFENGESDRFTMEGYCLKGNLYPSLYQGNHKSGSFEIELK